MTIHLPPHGLSRNQIERHARLMGLRISLPEQWAFLQDTGSLHLQAAPGSGKTSLVALKLSLIAQAWTSAPGQGVCVLSHTNTATEEIAQRLNTTPSGRRLLRYPHFLGTIQTFVHTFLALPNLRSQGIVVHAVDNDTYATHAARLYRSARYNTLREALRHKHDQGIGTITSTAYTFDPADGQLHLLNAPFKAHTKSYAALLGLKETLRLRGILRYEDMFALADQHLHHAPVLAAALRSRFPFVLLDEMQDTERMQQDLLLGLFGSGGSVMQCVGDINQRIFAASDKNAEEPWFPETTAVDLPVSQRFGTDIGRVASRLTARRRQEIHGAGPAGTLALIVYDDSTLTRVIPAFEELAAESVPAAVLAADPPRVLGSRTDPGASRLHPRSITCYDPYFTSTPAQIPQGRLIAAVRRAQHLRAHGDQGGRAATDLWDTIRELSRLITFDLDTPGTGLPLQPLSRLDRTPGQPGHRARRVLHSLLTAPLNDAPAWDSAQSALSGLLDDLTQVRHRPNDAIRETWLAFTPPAPEPVPAQRASGTPRALLGTIAGAKGETHSATLVLECANRRGTKHDLVPVLPLILGKGRLEDLSDLDRYCAQLAFVAVTRPRHLLALAVHRDRADPFTDAFRAAGWLIRTADPAGADTDACQTLPPDS
jgi:DNA helicase-2/ATP-dependent DNA helicase PcrA